VSLTLEPKTLKVKTAFAGGRVLPDALQSYNGTLQAERKDGVLLLSGLIELRIMDRAFANGWYAMSFEGALPSCPR